MAHNENKYLVPGNFEKQVVEGVQRALKRNRLRIDSPFIARNPGSDEVVIVLFEKGKNRSNRHITQVGVVNLGPEELLSLRGK